MRYSIVNLGCKVNRVEADGFARILSEIGFRSSSLETADVVVVNTCTVTGEADKKTRKAVRHALKANPSAQVVVTGCASNLKPEVFASMSERVAVVPKAGANLYLRELAEGLTDQANDLAGADAHAAGSDDESMIDIGSDAALFGSRTRRGVKVQDGCDNECTYCIVHVARGKATSRSVCEVEAEAVALARKGVREIVLTGINIGSYRDGACGLACLLECLMDSTEHIHAKGERPVRFRVSSIEPMDVDDDFIDVLAAANGRVCRHLHLPLQSGSSRVLQEMNRPYDAETFSALVQRLRKRVPGIALTTDIIVGFPGETEEDFEMTCSVARRCGFSKIHVFPYSRREGTPAALRCDQVAPEVKSSRAARLRRLSDELRSADLALRAATTEFALVEESGRAMTESYFEVPAPADAVPGTLVSFTYR